MPRLKEQSPHRDSWFAPLSLDLFLKVANVTFFHPFVCWLLPLCLRARTVKWEAPPMIGVILWAVFISLLWLANAVSQRVTFGLPREVDLGEEVIVITGGAGGLGMLIAEVYGMRGASVAVLDVHEMENGEARGVTFYKCDVGDKEQVAKVAAQIEREVSFSFPSATPRGSFSSPFEGGDTPQAVIRTSVPQTNTLMQIGTPTVLINNAAVVVGKSLLDISMEELDKSLSTNILGPFYCIKTFLPALVRSEVGGTIVNISSVIGHLGAAQLADYAAAKAGITALHKSLTAELGQTHPEIKTVLVTPGQLTTPLFYGVKTPNSFVAPVVEPVDVCKEVVAAIDQGKGAVIGTPLYARWVDWYNVLPVGLQVIARKVAGVDRGMKTYVGRDGFSGSGHKGR